MYVMQGLPGSGKTRAARELQREHPGTLRTNNDDLQRMLTGDGSWDPEIATVIRAAQDTALLAAVRIAQRDVIVDNTHLWPDRPDALRRLFTPGEVTFRVYSLTRVPVQDCLTRNAARERDGRPSVPELVILDMYARFTEARASGWELTDAWMNTQQVPSPSSPLREGDR